MSLNQFVIRLKRCPRCRWDALEILSTHMFCTNCNFSMEFAEGSETHDAIPEWALKALKSSNFEEVNQ